MNIGENGNTNLYKFIIGFGVLFVLSILEWIGKNPFTFIWILLVVGVVAYLWFTKDESKDPPQNPPPPSSPY